MPKDYAKRTTKRNDWYDKRSRKQSHPGLWMLIGLLLGLVIAGAFYIMQQPNNPFQHTAHNLFHASTKASPVAQPKKEVKATTAKTVVKNEPPRFDFYTILPKEQVPTTKVQDASQTVAQLSKNQTNDANDNEEETFNHLTQVQTAKAKAVEENAGADDDDNNDEMAADDKRYILQMGSFAKYSDADQLRAQLGLMGYETNIKTFDNDGMTISKVWLGPFKSFKAAQKIQHQLTSNQIKSELVKLS